MSSTVVDIADALAEALNDEMTLPVTARRRIQPTFDSAVSSAMEIVVVPKAFPSIAMETRKGVRYDVQVDVAVYKKVDDADEDVPPLLELLESMMQHCFQSNRIGTIGYAALIELSNSPIYSVELLRTKRVFLGVFTATYAVVRNIVP